MVFIKFQMVTKLSLFNRKMSAVPILLDPLTPEFMIVGLLTLDLHIPEAHSLKEKRFVIKSLIDRIKNKFNVSAAEVDANDLWQRSVIGIAYVSNETVMINKVFEQIRNLVVSIHSVELINAHMELL